jgi:hypothetical protein
MNLTRSNKAAAPGKNAFTLVDALFAILISGIMFTALYAGLAFGFRIIKMTRENTRATQIMLEHMEICRLYKWSDLTNTGPAGSSAFLKTNPFIVYYYSVGATNSSLLYTARISLAACPITNSYASDMRKLTVRLDWGALGAGPRTRSMSTYIARNGLQSYVW